MKPKVILVALLVSTASVATHAQPSAFTYQGRLNDSGGPVNGPADFEFRLFNAAAAGTQVGSTVAINDTGVTNGLFTAALDFGASAFDGSARWLEIAVRPGASTGAYTNLSPRQPITATPYAVRALTAGTATVATSVSAGGVGSATIADQAVTSSKIADGTVAAADVDAASFNTTFWRTGGNLGTTAGTHFLGTTGNQPLEIKVNGARVLRLEPNIASPNIVGGFAGNIVSNGVAGGSIVGGGDSSYPNRVGGSFATVIGGRYNTASGLNSSAMGFGNTASGSTATAMGYFAVASGGISTAMGNDTTASGYSSTAMGHGTVAGGDYSTALGQFAVANHAGSFVWADSTVAGFTSTAINQFSLRASGGLRLSDSTSMEFGTTPRQMLNLYGATYGIGVQSSSLYFRCDSAGANDGFIWYRGGVHDNGYAQPGAGGTELMHLVQGGLYVNGALVSSSDRNAKENFQPVDSQAVLEKVAALPLSRWNYKQDPTQQHLGPMAQDFHAAFGVGPDDKHITTVDADGVALAAIQGLNQKVEAQRNILEQKETEIAELKARLERLERLLQ